MFAAPGPIGPPPDPFYTVPPREEDVRRPVNDDEHPSCWRLIRAELQRAVPESAWHQWLEPLRGHQREDGTLVVVAPERIRPWVQQRFGDLLERCAGAVLAAGPRSSS